MAGIGVLLLLAAAPAQAHSLDEYVDNAYVTVYPDHIELEVALSPGALVVPAVLGELDPDADEAVTRQEAERYVGRVLAATKVTVDGVPVAFELTSETVPDHRVLVAGVATVGAIWTGPLPDPTDGVHRVSYETAADLPNGRFQTNAFVGDRTRVALGPQTRSDDQRRLEVAATLGPVPEVGQAAAGPAQPARSTGAPGAVNGLLDRLREPGIGLRGLLGLAGLSMLLGALHALTPGHGKTLVAAYLVGERGTMRHAAVLGGVVTFTHTVSVALVGVLALFASAFVVPGVLAPVLQIVSGVLVLSLGLVLLRRRWQARGTVTPAHDHGDDHGHSHEHSHRHGHSHGHENNHGHSHEVPRGASVRSLVALGISGGMVPCPEALAVMLLAVGLGRVALGLGLIVAFSVGLAGVLIGLGVALVRARGLVERFAPSGGAAARGIPIMSALVVTGLGAGIVAAGVSGLA